MLDVTDITRKIYSEKNVHKILTIAFPDNPDIEDITNENIEQESLKLTQSICEENAPEVGGCNSSQFEFTTIDVTDDINEKNLCVTLSCKDPSYKGEWQSGVEYSDGNIVSYEGDFYECIGNTAGIYTSDIVCNKVLLTQKSDTDLTYTALYQLYPHTGKRIVITYDETKRGTDTQITVTFWYTANDSRGYHTTHYIKNSGDEIIIPEGYTVNDKLCLTNDIEIKVFNSDSSINESDLVNSMDVSVEYFKPISNYPPDEISDYFRKLYGYVDTSQVEDITIFKGKIQQVKNQNDRRVKEILAYDKIYELQNTDISNWFNNTIADNNWKEDWTQGTLYKVGQIVRFTTGVNSSTGYVGYTIFYRCKKQITALASKYNPMVLCAGLTMMQSPPMSESEAKSFWDEMPRDDAYDPKKYVSIKTIRDRLFEYLGIEQQEVSLPMDDVLVYLKPINYKLMALDLLQQICVSNACFGWLNPQNDLFEYIKPTVPVSDEHYVGEFVQGASNNVGDVVVVNNEDTEYFNRYYECIKSTSGLTRENVQVAPCEGWIEPANGVKFHPPILDTNLIGLQINFNDELAERNNVSVVIEHYKGSTLFTLYKSGICEIERGALLTVTVNNVTEEFWDTFSINYICAAGKRASSYEPTNDLVSEFWNKKDVLYHPSGGINLTELYESDGVEYQDYSFVNSHNFYIEDSNGNVLLGSKTATAIPIKYDFLYESLGSSQFYEDILGQSEKFSLIFTPAKISCKGLPFLKVGDQVCFDVEEFGEIKTVNTIIMCRELSGINALTDKYEAKNE